MNSLKNILPLLLIINAYLLSAQIPEHNMRLWYDKPATDWNEALPVGNGKLGAMIYGGIETEKLQLNEETVWAGEPGNNIPNTGFYDSLPEIRRLIFNKKYSEAHDLAMKVVPRHAPDDNNYGMPYQTVGDLLLKFQGHNNTSNFYRDLDIKNAIASVSYTSKGITYKREIFASLIENVIVVKLTADKKNSISLQIEIESPHEEYEIKTSDNKLILSGKSGTVENKQGKVRFETYVLPVLSGGNLSSDDRSIKISDANSVILYVTTATNFNSYNDLSGNPAKRANQHLASAQKKSYKEHKESHISKYSDFFDRVSLDLGTTDAVNNPTNERLINFATTDDPQLVALYFQYGRYLLISSSQPGTQPANLQGIWNYMLKPPWDSKYTVNINTEMNYWPAEVTNLPELHEPLFRMLKELSITGQESASKMYGARGWNMHHNTDLWRITGPVDGAFYGLWPMGGAWLTQHIWQHYLYSGDEEFIEEYYPVLKGAALFYKDILQEEPENKWLVVNPSTSPENRHKYGTSLAAGNTMDNQLVFDVFTNFIKASDILNKDKLLADSVKEMKSRLAPMQVGQHGQLQEWMYDWDDPGDKHRHISHLYGLHPGKQISPFRNPELFQAAKQSLLFRGDKSTGWSMGWKVNFWARLLNGDRAYKLIHDQLSPSRDSVIEGGGTYPNLLDAHPPFQIDGNFGCTAGIAEMLLQSHDGYIFILPALPTEWKEGVVEGLMAQGGFKVNITWDQGEVSEIKILSRLGGNCRIRSYNELVMENGELKKAEGKNPNPFYSTADIKDPIVSRNIKLLDSEVPKTYLYDITTKPGETIILKKKNP